MHKISSSKFVCYLFTSFDKDKSINNFIKNYTKYKSGVNHKLIICYKLINNDKVEKLRNKLKKINYLEFIDKCTKNDWDFGSYKRLSEIYFDKDILFLNSHSYPACDNWLKKLFYHKKNNTVIAPTASYESLIDSVQLKKKYHKIIRYLYRKYKFSRWFHAFPNPHFRTSSFLINSKLFLKFIKNKKLVTKEDTLKIESGRNSLTNYLKKKKIKIYVVNSDGKKFEEKKWKLSETYCFKYKNKSIISDKHTRKYPKLNKLEKLSIRQKVWGDKND